MDRIKIRGGAELKGAIPISGAKNAALPLMIASLLTDQTLTLENLPRLADVPSRSAAPSGPRGSDHCPSNGALWRCQSRQSSRRSRTPFGFS